MHSHGNLDDARQSEREREGKGMVAIYIATNIGYPCGANMFTWFPRLSLLATERTAQETNQTSLVEYINNYSF